MRCSKVRPNLSACEKISIQSCLRGVVELRRRRFSLTSIKETTAARAGTKALSNESSSACLKYKRQMILQPIIGQSKDSDCCVELWHLDNKVPQLHTTKSKYSLVCAKVCLKQ